jgi:ribosomal protein L16 Arg81 hydroxylase
MTCQFLDNLALASLIAPVSETEFRTRYWEQEPLVIHRKNRDFYGDLFTLQDFDQAITRSPDYVKLANYATNKNASYKAGMVKGLEAVLADMRDGGTLVLDQMHNREPKLALLCRALGPEFGYRFQTNLYLTPPHGKGFSPHWDNHDVFILQVLGSKHWKIEKERRCFPGKSETMGEEGREIRGEPSSFTLEQGDLIYIPRGFIHAAECGTEPSLHITLGVTAIFWDDLLNAIIKAAVLRDPRLRTALPLGSMNGSPKALVAGVMTTLREITDEKFLTEVVDQFRDELVQTFPLDVSGQIVDFFQPTPLTIADRVGPRPGIVYQMHNGGDSVRLNYGARSIVFRDFFGKALDFALKTPVYAVRDLPGELEDEERVALIERLIEEGVVIRKQERAL